MSFVIISALMQFASFALAPQSIITPLGAFTLVVNLVMANRFLGEPLGKIDIIGTQMSRSAPTRSRKDRTHTELDATFSFLQALF